MRGRQSDNMAPSRFKAFVFALLVSLCASMVPPQDDLQLEPNRRGGKILPFGPNFWDGFEKGIRNTAEILHRVSENIEVAVDQLTDSVGEEFTDMADRIEDRVEQSLPPFLRTPLPGQIPNGPDIEAISGVINPDETQDGVKVFYDTDDPMLEEDPTVETSLRNEQVAFVDQPPKTPSAIDHHFGFDFEGSIFRPFHNFAPFGIRNQESGGGLFNMFRRRQWWNGPNVCVDREEIDEPEQDEDDQTTRSRSDTEEGETEKQPSQSGPKTPPASNLMFGIGNMQFSSCKETENKYSCVTNTNRRGISKSVRVTYRCCHGFVRESSGCTKVEVSEMPDTLQQIKAVDYLTLFKAANLLDALDTPNQTIFAPQNEAVQEFMDELQENNEINGLSRRKRDIRDLTPYLMGHITDGFIYAGDLEDEQVLISKNAQTSTLRINSYASFPPTVTVNCARLITANQHSVSGVVHTIDKVLTPVTRSAADVIATDPQFSILKQLIVKAGLMTQLDEATQLTIFAPTNAAFKSLPANMLDGLTEGTFCLKAVLMNHFLPNTICSAAVTSKAKTLNMLDEFLILDRKGDDKIYVEDALITARDVLTTNGVMHIIDGVLIPQEAKPVIEVLESHKLTRFLELIDEAQMREEFNQYVDVTVFAPSNAAIEALSQEENDELRSDPVKLKQILRHHVTSSALQARDINNNHITTTQADHPLRINLYSRVPLLADIVGRDNTRAVRVTAGCSRASSLNSRACGAVVHIVEDILRVPEKSIMRQLEKQKSHSIFLGMIKDVAMDKDLEASGPYTVLAPSNHVLKALPEEELSEILSNEELKKKVVKRHILYENICCSGINPSSWVFMDRKRSMDNARVHVRRSPNGRLMADHARITKCGNPAENGIVHTINRMLVDPIAELSKTERRTPFTRAPWLQMFRL